MEPDPILPKAASDEHRVRRALSRLATATALAGPILVLTADAASARIAVNHNEAVGRDRSAPAC